MKYKLKPINWIETEDAILANVVNHTYKIREIIGEVFVFYHDTMTDKCNSKQVASVQEGMDWVVNTHIPSELEKWFEVVE